MRKAALLVVALSVMSGLLACKNLELREAEFTPKSIDVLNRINGSVNVKVLGGRDAGPVVFEQVPRGAFENALRTAITNERIFKNVTATDADFQLLVDLSHFIVLAEGAGPSTYECTARWKLTKSGQREPLWEVVVSQKGTSSIFDGGQRTQQARERAVQANITEALRLLSRQSF